MIIYHGSTVLVEKPEIRISDSFLISEQAFIRPHLSIKQSVGQKSKCAERARISDMFRSTNLILS